MLFLSISAPLAMAELPAPEKLHANNPATFRSHFIPHNHHGNSRPLLRPDPHPEMGWDILHYDFEVDLDPTERPKKVYITSTIQAQRTTGQNFVLHADGPEISSLTVNGVETTWEQDGDTILLGSLDEVVQDTVEIQLTYTASDSDFGGLQWESNIVYSFHEPRFARKWLVCYDNPADKSTVAWTVTVPSGQVVAANGQLVSVTEEDEQTTWSYQFDGQIATYLMALHVSDYVVLESGINIPIYSWVYPGYEEAATQTFATTEEMLDYFSTLYGPYPWSSYGNAMAPMSGAMEHTTVTTFGEDLVGTDWGELVNAHEVGHHWWGDDVTLGTWKDIWLNEAFASYTEALWYEYNYDQEGLESYVAYQLESYREWNELEGIFPLYSPIFMWGGTVYDKGSLVMHMLRGVLGDEVFFQALQNYEQEFRFGTAVSSDFIASASTTAGRDLQWFFDGWLYTAGEPIYSYDYQQQQLNDGSWQLDIVVEQDKPEFTMPLPVRITLQDGTIMEDSIWVEDSGGSLQLCLDSQASTVELDPDFWLPLVEKQQISINQTTAITCSQNPAEPSQQESSSKEDVGGCNSANLQQKQRFGLLSLFLFIGLCRRCRGFL